MYLSHESMVSELFALLSILFNVIGSPCLAQPLDSNTSIINATNSEVKKPTSEKPDFPDRRGFFTGHRIPLELFPEDTLRHIELIEEKKEQKPEGALERVPPGYPRRIPLELFSEETLRRIDGLDKEEENFPRRIPLELSDEETLRRVELLDEKNQEDIIKETSKQDVELPKATQQYINSDLLRASEEELVELMRTPRRLYIHGGVNDDPEAAAHHFPALTIGGEGDPAFLDTLLSYYN